ncbi:hypothetical protein GGH98_005361, partial [Coemansia sp. RSA 454]
MALHCYTCGNVGHKASDCTETEKLCYNCREPGHMSQDCPEPHDVSVKTCFNCQEKGHISADCPSPRAPRKPAAERETTDAPRSARSKRPSTLCHNCGKPNHMAKGCTKPQNECNQCGRTGHIAKFCRDRQQDDVDTRTCHV